MNMKRIIRILIVTGQSSQWHNWAVSHKALECILSASELFEVSVVASPAQGEDMSGFKLNLGGFDLVVIDYEGDDWPEAARESLEAYVSKGGGLVIYHASDNAFPSWPAYNEMCGVGGWADRDESVGPKVRWRDGAVVLDNSSGVALHPKPYDFTVTARDSEHPIMKGLPSEWLQTFDEMYSQLRGPAKNLTVLATAIADPEKVEDGTGENEPMLMTIVYGEGRVFHTTLGHVAPGATETPECMKCVGFITTLLRGAEWAATGEVNQAVPDNW